SCRSILLLKSRRGGMADAEDLKSSGRERPCGFDSHRRYSESDRLNRASPEISGIRATSEVDGSISSSRPNPAVPVPSRSLRATRVCVVAPAPEDNPRAPGLPGWAAVVEAWPGLPEALKAGIVAMVRASRS